MAKKNSSDEKLSKKERRRRIAELIEPFRVTRGKGFSLRDYDPDDSLEIARRRTPKSCCARACSSSRACRTDSTRRTSGACC